MTTNPMRAALDAVAQQLHDDDPAEFHGTEATHCRFCAEPDQTAPSSSAVSVAPPATNQTEAGQVGEEQPETPLEKRLRYSERRNDELRAESLRRGKTVLEYAEKIVALERQIDEVRSQLGAEILRAGQAEAELRRMADEATPVAVSPADANGTAASVAAPVDRAALDRARSIARRLAAHAVGFQDVLDDSDRDPWAKTVGADIAELCAALDAGLPAVGSCVAAEAPHTVAPDDAAALLALVRDFLDPDPCSFDHHGYCQAHAAGFGGEPLSCPHGRARKLLAAVDAPAVVAQPGKEAQPPIRCNAAHLRVHHAPHGWEPQPGMQPIPCPGYPQLGKEA